MEELGVVLVEVDAVAQGDELLGVVLLGDLLDGVEQTDDVLGEVFVVLGDLLREREGFRSVVDLVLRKRRQISSEFQRTKQGCL